MFVLVRINDIIDISPVTSIGGHSWLVRELCLVHPHRKHCLGFEIPLNTPFGRLSKKNWCCILVWVVWLHDWQPYWPLWPYRKHPFPLERWEHLFAPIKWLYFRKKNELFTHGISKGIFVSLKYGFIDDWMNNLISHRCSGFLRYRLVGGSSLSSSLLSSAIDFSFGGGIGMAS